MLTLIRNILRFSISFFIVSIAVVILMDKVIMPIYVNHGKSVTLQDVRNIPLDKARRRLAELGLESEIQDSVTNPNLRPNTVLEQTPKPGTRIKKGRAVFLVITKGKEYVQMPVLNGLTYKEAKLILSQINLNIDSTEYIYHYDYPKDVICEQSIHPGMLVSIYTGLTIKISNGPPVQTYIVPDIFGLSLDAATHKIEESGFTLGNIFFIPNSDLTPNTVIGQRPMKDELFFDSIPIELDVTKTNN